METTNVKDADAQISPNGAKTNLLYNMVHAQAIHIVLEPDESLKKHVAPVDVIFYVLEGAGVIEIADETQEVGPGTLIDCPAMSTHCWYNNNSKILRVLVVKVPPSPRIH